MKEAEAPAKLNIIFSRTSVVAGFSDKCVEHAFGVARPVLILRVWPGEDVAKDGDREIEQVWRRFGSLQLLQTKSNVQEHSSASSIRLKEWTRCLDQMPKYSKMKSHEGREEEKIGKTEKIEEKRAVIWLKKKREKTEKTEEKRNVDAARMSVNQIPMMTRAKPKTGKTQEMKRMSKDVIVCRAREGKGYREGELVNYPSAVNGPSEVHQRTVMARRPSPSPTFLIYQG
ncbi:hypothetical protein ARMSODRAFT_983360 [Armillaria solidipes]|uniref:Uncharacterized protein n=1 Tax=Armillaria solidipes TaxID=1076256 RepID=A0A2H3AZ89_9AGAR|nr:hypothetical protein ARMSODRAFT_983360 [Armillaria solidipes]